MSDDASYLSFLNKANAAEPLSAVQQESTSTSSARSKFDPTSTASASAAPPSISSLLSSSSPPHYVSETDSPFEPFFAPYSGESLPSAEEFAKSAGVKEGKWEVMETGEWDPRGQYGEVVEAVRKAGDEGAGVRVYRLEVSGTRGVYFVVTLAEKGSKLVGVKAESVES